MALSTALRWSVAQTVVRMTLGLASAKVSAIYLGPAGLPLVAQVGNLIQVAHGVIGNGAQTAVVKLTASRQERQLSTSEIWSTALVVVLTAAAFYFLLSAAGAQLISKWLLAGDQYSFVILFASVAVFAAVSDSILVGALNGLKRIDLISKAAIASAALEVTTYTLLVIRFGLWGGLYGISAVYLVKLAATWVISSRAGAFSAAEFVGPLDHQVARTIGSFYPMLIAHSMALPLSQIMVRDMVIDRVGVETAGQLQAVWRLSEMYVSVFTTALGMYFISHYSSLTESTARLAMVKRTVVQFLLLTAAAAALIYQLRYFVFEMVLSRDFLPAAELLPIHLLGDVMKIGAYVLQMTLVAEARGVLYVSVAVGGPLVYVLVAWLLVPSWSSQAAPIAYSISHLASFATLLIALKVRPLHS